MSNERTETTDRDERLNAVLLEYVEALERAETPNRYELLAANPEFAAELLEFFKGRDQVDQLAAPLREASRVAGTELGTLGDFRLLREVGRGGMGVVYEAEQISLRRRVALKVLPFAAAMDPRQLQRFQNEAQAAAHLHHTNIVPVFAVGTERGVHYYAMQFIEGQSLAALLDDLRETRNSELGVRNSKPRAPNSALRAEVTTAPYQVSAAPPPPPPVTTKVAAALTTERPGGRHYFRRAAALVRQAAEALEHAHQMGVVHRDIKPANLLLDRRGELWITDFGLAQFCNDVGLTLSGELLGTLRYASPEQAMAKRGLIDHRTDIYSLGVTLYELLTLAPVFAGRDRQELLGQIAFDEPRPPRSHNAAIPVELETIVLKAIAKNPAERYASARDLADDVQRFLDDKPILARRPSLLDRATKWARRHRSLVATGLVLLLLAVIGLAVSNVLIAKEQRAAKAAAHSADVKAKEADEERMLADRRFKQARRSVARFSEIAEEELAGSPFNKARRKFLEAALIYYQEFLADAGDDPSVQEELKESLARVDGILKELTELEGSGRFLLLTEKDVQDDLNPRPDQREKLAEYNKAMQKRGQEMFRDFHKLTNAERQQRFLEAARANEAAANAILTPPQRARLKQIELQQKGSQGFLEGELAAALKLTPRQQERVRAIQEEMGRELMPKPGRGGPDPFPQMAESSRQITKKVADDVLTPEQREQWRELTGPTFTGTIRRPPPATFVRPFPPPTPPGQPP
jgi:serine/threonine protein kinase